MKALKKTVLIALGMVIVVLVFGCAGGYWFVTRSHPQISGTPHVAGLQSRVEVVRDPLGVPHIYAAKPDDLFFAQGYVQPKTACGRWRIPTARLRTPSPRSLDLRRSSKIV